MKPFWKSNVATRQNEKRNQKLKHLNSSSTYKTMLSYYFKCRKNKENKSPKVARTQCVIVKNRNLLSARSKWIVK